MQVDQSKINKRIEGMPYNVMECSNKNDMSLFVLGFIVALIFFIFVSVIGYLTILGVDLDCMIG